MLQQLLICLMNFCHFIRYNYTTRRRSGQLEHMAKKGTTWLLSQLFIQHTF